MLHMSRIIFDIETVGVDFSTLDEQAREYLLKAARTPEERDAVPETLSFSPLTGEVVAIAMLNPDTGKGAVYYRSGDAVSAREENGIAYETGSERDILEKFWRTLGFYDQIVTFNGRSFDGPFLMVRSAVHGITCGRNLVPYRYGDDHIDLYDRLGYFGAVRRTMSLHMWCRAFGITSPKANGVTGYEVAALYEAGRYDDIARYCMDDVRATTELWRIWDRTLNVK